MSAVNPPFRADHVGSLLRPKELLQARYAEGTFAPTPEQLKALEDKHIPAVIKLQEDVGLQSITDGEYRRESWRSGFVAKVDGFVRVEPTPGMGVAQNAKGETHVIGAPPFAARKLKRTRPIVRDEFDFVRARTQRTPKVTMPAPSYLHFLRGDACADRTVYPDLGQYFDDLIGVYHAEIDDLAAAGCTYVQLDEVWLPGLCDEKIRAQARARGDDPDKLVDLYVGLINRVASRRPKSMTMGVHFCRGNSMGKWIAEGGYDYVAEKVFGGLEVDALFLEYDTDRAGTFEPLRHVSAEKTVVLGLVSTKTPKLETKAELMGRLDAAAKFVPLDRLCLSPQCGFASRDKGNPITVDDEVAKLRLVVETAAEVWR
jgi:5-methyltetrahydropteroyltriglutamate--homocysteine methyltransferase